MAHQSQRLASDAMPRMGFQAERNARCTIQLAKEEQARLPPVVFAERQSGRCLRLLPEVGNRKRILCSQRDIPLPLLFSHYLPCAQKMLFVSEYILRLLPNAVSRCGVDPRGNGFSPQANIHTNPNALAVWKTKTKSSRALICTLT